MIKVTRLNKTELFINPLLIETLEEAPDTIVSLTTGKKYVIRESASEIIDLMKQYFNDIHLLKGISFPPPGGQDV